MKTRNNMYNSKFFRFFDYVFRIVLINLLIIIPSFLLLYLTDWLFKGLTERFDFFYFVILIPMLCYLVPTLFAGVDLIVKYELNITRDVFKEFFKSLKKVWKKALIFTVLIIVLVILLGNSLLFFFNNLDQGIVYLVGFILTLSFITICGCIILHLPLTVSYFEGCAFYHDLSLATMMAFKDLGITLALVAATALIIGVGVVSEFVLVSVLTSLPMYLSVKLTFKKYYIVYVRTNKKKKDDNITVEE